MRADDAMNAEEVAAYLGIGKNSVYLMAKEGTLPSYRVGRKLRFTLEGIHSYLDSTRTGPADPPSKVGSPAGGSFSTSSPFASARFSATDRETPSCEIARAAALFRAADSPFIVAGEVNACAAVASYLNDEGVFVQHVPMTDYSALVSLYAGTADIALTGLYDLKTNAYNVPFVQRLVPGVSAVVFRLLSRRVGFAVSPGNPKGLSGWGALLRAGVRLANREPGCGHRVLLDQKLRSMEARADNIDGYADPRFGEAAAASLVAQGTADVAVIRSGLVRCEDGLEFIDMQREWIDMTVVKTERTRPLLRSLRAMVSDGGFFEGVARADDADASGGGAILYEV